MKPIKYFLPALALSCSAACAQSTDPQATAFLRIFLGTCMQHLTDLDALREKLKAFPSLPPAQANLFLGPMNMTGPVWPVPDPSGLFVLALPTGKNFCAVFARRLTAADANDGFAKLLQSPPQPLRSSLVTDVVSDDNQNGRVRRLGYQWSVEGAARKLNFILTTKTGEAAELQGLATASIGQD